VSSRSDSAAISKYVEFESSIRVETRLRLSKSISFENTPNQSTPIWNALAHESSSAQPFSNIDCISANKTRPRYLLDDLEPLSTNSMSRAKALDELRRM
jgi:hypothetical protein